MIDNPLEAARLLLAQTNKPSGEFVNGVIALTAKMSGRDEGVTAALIGAVDHETALAMLRARLNGADS